MEVLDVRNHIETFVRQQFNVNPTDPNFSRETDLLEEGYVDSVGVIEVLGFLQAEYGVEIPDSDLMSDDFANIDGMARIVYRLVKETSTTDSEELLLTEYDKRSSR